MYNISLEDFEIIFLTFSNCGWLCEWNFSGTEQCQPSF